MGDAAPRLTRRRLLALIAAAGIGACSRDTPAARPPTRPPAANTPSPPAIRTPDPATAEPSPTPSPEAHPAFEPLEADLYPNAKRLAGRFVQELTTYDEDESPAEIGGRALVEPAPGTELDDILGRAAPLHRAGTRSIGEIVYPQLGGLAPAEQPAASSVMVVVRQTFHDPDATHLVERTVDVRLRVVDGHWRIEDLADAGGREVDLDEVDGPGREVLDSGRIALPDSARWDIAEGVIDERLLATLLEMADLYPFSVCTLRNGHPLNVFGTQRQSNHAAGRAVDVWAVDGSPVVTQQPETGTPAWEMTRSLFEGRVVQELGAPWAFDGFGGRSFTNEVHQDHLHVAFYGR